MPDSSGCFRIVEAWKLCQVKFCPEIAFETTFVSRPIVRLRADADMSLWTKREPPVNAFEDQVVWITGASQVGNFTKWIFKDSPVAYQHEVCWLLHQLSTTSTSSWRAKLRLTRMSTCYS